MGVVKRSCDISYIRMPCREKIVVRFFNLFFLPKKKSSAMSKINWLITCSHPKATSFLAVDVWCNPFEEGLKHFQWYCYYDNVSKNFCFGLRSDGYLWDWSQLSEYLIILNALLLSCTLQNMPKVNCIFLTCIRTLKLEKS